MQYIHKRKLTIVISQVILQVMFVFRHKNTFGAEKQLLWFNMTCRKIFRKLNKNIGLT